MRPGDKIILDNPSPQYRAWKGKTGSVLQVDSDFVDIVVDGDCVLRVAPRAVSLDRAQSALKSPKCRG